MKYPSEKSLLLSIILWATNAILILFLLMLFIKALPTVDSLMKAAGFILITLLAFLLFVLITWSWLSTYYVLGDHDLKIVYGPFRKIIPYTSIRSYRMSNSAFSGPALSFHRIEINYDEMNYTVVSPKNQSLFLTRFREKCPQARFDDY